MESRQTDQIQFVVLRHSEKSLLHSPFPVYEVLSEVEKLSMKIKFENHDLVRQPDFQLLMYSFLLQKFYFENSAFLSSHIDDCKIILGNEQDGDTK